MGQQTLIDHRDLSELASLASLEELTIGLLRELHGEDTSKR